MKNSLITCLLICASICASAQSASFKKFRDKFGYADDIHSFKTNGFWIRTVLGMGGEHEAKRALKHIGKVRLIAVPKAAFDINDVSVEGFKKVLHTDGYGEIMNVREDGSDVTVYEIGDRNAEGRYMVLVEDKNEVVLIEVTGYVDREYLRSLFVINKDQRS